MKTGFYIFAFVVCGSVLMVPRIPRPYPPKPVQVQQGHIVVQENHINRLIHEIEYRIAKDSLQINR